jgi:Cu(I)/Ag(I) efflux system membrane fusion protein
MGTRNLTLILASLTSAGLGAGAVWLASHRGHDHVTPAAAAAEKKQVWICPMHPTVVDDRESDCPICGMKLVPMEQVPEAAEATRGLATVTIDPARQQLIGLRTAAVAMGPVGAAWRTVGRVAVDETRVRHINVKFSGFVERIHVDFIGKPVARGQTLFTIYSPDVVAAQEEYLLAVKTRGTLGGSLVSSGDSLVEAARRKLQLWDISASDIERLERTGQVVKALPLRSPIAGVVVKKDVVEGMQLEAGAMPYEIVDLSKVWVLADVYESELARVKVGMPATLTLKAFPQRRFGGNVAFIDPVLDPQTRTVKVRLSFANPDGELRPEMFGEVVLESPLREGLRIPADAVIHSGTRAVAFVALGEGKLQPREVKLGQGDGQFVEVIDGLGEGEQVVTRANFLVDSESRLRASLAAMAAESGVPSPAAASAADPHAGHR